jgi:hypothetical protein
MEDEALCVKFVNYSIIFKNSTDVSEVHFDSKFMAEKKSQARNQQTQSCVSPSTMV